MRSSDVLRVFVIMPISGSDYHGKNAHSEDYWRDFYGIIETALRVEHKTEILELFRKRHIHVKRMESSQGNIIDAIIRDLIHADVVVAVLTDHNPNVLYELAIRHSLAEGSSVMLLEKGQVIPFDLKVYGMALYEDQSDMSARISGELI